MTSNSNLSPLPWYTDIEQQNFRQPYSFGEVYPLYCFDGTCLPWQILRAKGDGNIGSIVIQLYRKDGTFVKDLTDDFLNQGMYLDKTTSDEYDIIMFYPQGQTWQIDEPGQYYMTLDDETQMWFSEIFTVVPGAFLPAYLKIEWWDDSNVEFDGGMVLYKADNGSLYHNELYLDSQICKPAYNYEEEGETRDGYFFPEKQLSSKTFQFVFVAPEYLCDCLRLARLADHVRITDRLGREYGCDTFLMSVEWQQQGNLASVTVEFTTDTVVKKIGNDINS